MKRITALILCMILVMSSVLPITVQAEQADTSPQTPDEPQTSDISPKMIAKNTFGELLVKDLQTADVAGTGQGEYVISDVTIENGKATVEYYAEEDCTILLAFYDNDSAELLASAYKAVSRGEGTSTVDINNCPEYFVLKGYMLDGDNAPLCEPFSTNLYTEELQYVENLSVDMFEENEVLNLDDNSETNFAVYNEDVIVINSAEGENIPRDVMPSDGVFVFDNANSQLKSLKPGDKFVYVYDDTAILVDAADITVSGDTVSITRTEQVDMSTFFDYVKIDLYGVDSADESNDNAIEKSGVHSSGDKNYSGSIPISLTWGEDFIGGKPAPSSDTDSGTDTHSDSDTNSDTNSDKIGKVSVSGSATGGISAKYTDRSYYKNGSVEEKTLTISLDLTIKAAITGELKKEIELPGLKIATNIIGVYFSLTPKFVVQANAVCSIAFSLSPRFVYCHQVVDGVLTPQNRSRSPFSCVSSVEPKAEGEVYAGIIIVPALKFVFGGDILPVDVAINAGLRAKGGLYVFSGKPADKAIHTCSSCMEGDLSIPISMTVDVKEWLKKTIKVFDKFTGKVEGMYGKVNATVTVFSTSIDLGQFYYSIEHNTYGWTKCPYRGELVKHGECGADGDNLTYSLFSTGHLLIFGKGAMANYSADEPAPWSDHYVYIVYFMGKPTTIGSYAFRKADVSQLTVAGLIGKKLSGISLPDSVGYIGDHAFEKCSLDTLKLPNSVVEIGDYAFSENCIKDITIPEGVTFIGEGAFKGNDFQDLTIPNSVTEIGAHAFRACNKLETVKLPNAVKTIAPGTFYGCASLKAADVPSTVASIGEEAFAYCGDLSVVTLPDTVEEIGSSAFLYCQSLENITLPKKLSKLGESAFQYCYKLKSVTVPSSVKTIEKNAFSYCESLVDAVIENGVEIIGGSAFYNCEALKNLSLPDSLKEIGGFAFWFCKSLETVTIPGSVEEIGHSAFSDCSSLKTAVLQEGVTYAYFCMFQNTALTSIYLPVSFETAFAYAFESNSEELVIYYAGSSEQWENVELSEFWHSQKFTVVYDTAPPVSSGAFDSKSLGIAQNTPDTPDAPVNVDGFTGLLPNTGYMVYIARSLNDDNTLDLNTLVYVELLYSDENGNIDFQYKNTIGESLYIGISGEGVKDIAQLNYAASETKETTDTADVSSETDVSTDDTDTSTDNTDTSADNTDTSTDNTDTSTDNTDTSTDNTDTSTDNTDISTDDTDTTPDEPEPVCGDLDNDGQITSSDALLILRMSVGIDEADPTLADVDGDGQITSADALEVLRFSVGLSDNQRIAKTA